MAPNSKNMSGYKNFAIVGAGTLGNFVIRQFLKEKAAGAVNEVVVLTRQVSARPHGRKEYLLERLRLAGLHHLPVLPADARGDVGRQQVRIAHADHLFHHADVP